jgi:hypothetical protein
VTLAEIQPDDAEAVAAAVRCERGLEHAAGARRVLAAVTDARTRERVERLAAEPAPAPRVRGALVIDASWRGEADVDVALITPDGNRLSWMGGRTTVVGADAGALGHESLGLRRAQPGSYVLEVSRADDSEVPVSGTLRVRVLGERRSVPFSLGAERRVTVARVDVQRRSRLVAVPR